jgi:hypothetical protein
MTNLAYAIKMKQFLSVWISTKMQQQNKVIPMNKLAIFT